MKRFRKFCGNDRIILVLENVHPYDSLLHHGDIEISPSRASSSFVDYCNPHLSLANTDQKYLESYWARNS